MKTDANEFDSLTLLEDAVLGTCLAAPWHFGRVVELVTPEDFSGRASRQIYVALLAMHARGVTPDSILLTVELCDSKKLSVLEHVGTLLQIGTMVSHLKFSLRERLQRGKAV